MKAAVYYGRGDVRIEDQPAPTHAGTGEVVLQVLKGSFCGSELSEFTRGPVMAPLDRPHAGSGHHGPVILGHEFVGKIIDIGPGVERLAVGQRVVPGAGMWCGQCRQCKEGRINICERYFVYGLHAHGGLAEYVKVPAKMCVPVPDACADESAAIAQPCSIALHALRKSGASPGQSLALIGVGGIGMLILAAAHALGIESIIALDIDDKRLARAKKLGATTVIDGRTGDPGRIIHDLTGGDGADLVIEASGVSTGPRHALASVRRGGRVLLVGLQTEQCSLDLHTVVVHEIDLISSNGHVCGQDLPQALSLLAAKPELAATIIDRAIPLDELVENGFRASIEGKVHGKTIITIA